jgi:hypothetical protein
VGNWSELKRLLKDLDKKMHRIFTLSFFLLCSYLAIGQTDEDFPDDKVPNYDTNYIQSYTDYIGLYTFALRKYRTYGLRNKALKTKLKFEPNGQTNLGLGLSYKWMNFGVSTSFEFMNKDNQIYGETSRFDLQLNAFSRYLGLNAHYQKYIGFYLSNPNDFLNWTNSYFPYMSNLQSSSIGVSLFYIFNNKKFSYKAAYIRNEVQKKSAGGFILGAYSDIDIVYAPSGFIPHELSDSLKQYYNFNGYSTYVTGISFGYTYTLVFLKRCFVNLSLVPGIGYRALSIWYISSSKQIDPSFTGSVTGRMSIAYEGKKMYFGISAISSAESFKYESIDISSNSGLIRLYLGKRFQFGKKRI